MRNQNKIKPLFRFFVLNILFVACVGSQKNKNDLSGDKAHYKISILDTTLAANTHTTKILSLKYDSAYFNDEDLILTASPPNLLVQKKDKYYCTFYSDSVKIFVTKMKDIGDESVIIDTLVLNGK